MAGEQSVASLSWRVALGTVFFASGAVSLVYEVVWARSLALVLGNSSAAHTLVVAVFMGGLGAGYVLFGRLADRVQHPMRWYAGLEIGISVWAAASLWLLDLIGPIGESGTGLWATTAVLLIPTTLMGGTLPLLARGLVNRGLGLGASVASLYAVNSAGAVVGTLASGLALIELLGVSATLYVAVGINLCLAPAAMLLARQKLNTQPAPDLSPEQSRAVDVDESGESDESGAVDSAIGTPTHVSAVFLGAAACVLGFIALGLQGVWLRYFGMVLGSSSYAFTVVIGVFIAGIALGGSAARRWVHRWRHRPVSAAAVLTAALAIALLVTEPLYERFPYTLVVLKHAAIGTAGTDLAGFAFYTLLRLGLVCTVVLIPTALTGALLPMLTAAAAPHRSTAATLAGRIFAANTAGSVLGVVVTVPLCIGAWGLGETYRVVTALTVICGFALMLATSNSFRLEARIGAPILAIAALLVIPAGWDARLLSAGGFRMKTAPQDYQQFARRARSGSLVFHVDGPNATVLVVDSGGHRTLVVNGKPDASTRGDMLTQIGSGHLPVLLHPAPERVLIVGLGSGVTVGSAALHPIAIDAVELSPAVVAASHAFDAVNGRPLEQPGVSLHVQDARSFLSNRPVGSPRYDVVVSEPSNPWIAGNAGLFGLDFFKLVDAHLADDGVYAQWIHLYETDDESVEMVIRTLGRVFEHLTLWEMFPNDVLLIARRGGATNPPNTANLLSRMTPTIRYDLRRVHLQTPAALRSLQAVSSEAMRALADTPGPITTDAHPLLEFRAPRGLFAGARAGLLNRHDERRKAPAGLEQADAEALFVLHTVYPGAPTSYRLSLLPQILANSPVPFLIDVLFTLTEEKHLSEASTVEQHLGVSAPEVPLALYARARFHQATETAEGRRLATDLLGRCIRQGDEPKGRCGRRFSQLSGASR